MLYPSVFAENLALRAAPPAGGSSADPARGALVEGATRSDRDATVGENPLALHHRWQELRVRLHDALAALTADDMVTSRMHPGRGSIPGREVLLLVARHAAEHRGQAELTRDLLLAAAPASA